MTPEHCGPPPEKSKETPATALSEPTTELPLTVLYPHYAHYPGKVVQLKLNIEQAIRDLRKNSSLHNT